MLLPAPVAPTTAIFSPGRAANDTPRSTGTPFVLEVHVLHLEGRRGLGGLRAVALDESGVFIGLDVFFIEQLKMRSAPERALQHGEARRQQADRLEERRMYCVKVTTSAKVTGWVLLPRRLRRPTKGRWRCTAC